MSEGLMRVHLVESGWLSQHCTGSNKVKGIDSVHLERHGDQTNVSFQHCILPIASHVGQTTVSGNVDAEVRCKFLNGYIYQHTCYTTSGRNQVLPKPAPGSSLEDDTSPTHTQGSIPRYPTS